MQKKHAIQFTVFGGIMAVIHLIQCVFRVKAHEMYLQFTASATAADNALWHQFGNYGRYTEFVYYAIGILFFVLIGYRLIYQKIRFRFALGATCAAYLVSVLVGVAFHFLTPSVSNLLLPVFISFFAAVLITVSAGLKRNQYQKTQQNK